MERFPVKISIQADGPVSQGAQVGDEEWAAAHWSRRKFLAGVAAGAGALAQSIGTIGPTTPIATVGFFWAKLCSNSRTVA
jgi:hypothetical protein